MRYILIFLMGWQLLFAFGFVGEGQKIVPVEEAYKPSITVGEKGVDLTIRMAKGVYLYKKDLHLKELTPLKREIVLTDLLPPPQKEHGEEVYKGKLHIEVPFDRFDGKKVTVALEFQGCNEVGICYPPQHHEYHLTLPTVKRSVTPKSVSQEASIANTLKNANLGIVLVTFFGFGLLLALTPCIFPMIPILSSLIVGAKNMNTKKAFIYSLVYVLAMALTYTFAGILAALFGANLQASLQHPVVIILFALIFIALAFSMFGFYEIGLPASLQTKLSRKSDEASSKGGLLGVAIMGFLSALIVGPCVAPPLAGALIYIGQTGDVLLGGLALFVMSLGMGAPLLLVGVGAGKFMPKPGGWMQAVSQIFGVVMLGVAIWMLGRILPDSVTLFLWAALFIGSAIYLRALEPIAEGAHWLNYFKKSVGILLFIYGLFLLFGAFTGASNPLDPLEVLKQKGVVSQERPLFKKVHSLEEIKRVVKEAKKPVIVDVSAKWCVSCKELDETTFKDPRVRKALKDFVALRFDVTENSPQQRAFLRSFGLYGPPAILFFKDGKEFEDLRIVGYKDPDSFLQILRKVQR